MTTPTQPNQRQRRNGKFAADPTVTAERRSKVLTMRAAGSTWERIGEQLGITGQQARNDYRRGIQEWVKIPAEALIERQKCIHDALIRTNFPVALDRTAPDHYEAQSKILECLRDEAKLFGLARPPRLEIGISEQEFGRAAADLLAVTGREPLLELVKDTDVLDAEVVEGEGERWANL